MPSLSFLLDQIEKLQVREANSVYPIGNFPGKRTHNIKAYQREDSNIYYTSLVAFILNENRKYFSVEDQDKIDQILFFARKAFKNYQSPTYPYLYNFYRQDVRGQQYPNGRFLSKFDHFRLPEDADDTAIISMCLAQEDQSNDRLTYIRSKLAQFANLARPKKASLPKGYEDLQAYSVWFGSGVMPVEFDLCVSCNVLYYIFKSQCQLNQNDIDTLEFVRRAIISKDIINKAFDLSYTYPHSSVIMYHVARLYSIVPQASDVLPKDEIQQQINFMLSSKKMLNIEKLMLHTALQRVSGKPSAFEYNLEQLEEEFEHFSYFKAPMLKGFAYRIFDYLSRFEFIHLKFTSRAFYLCLVLEFEIEKTKLST